MVGIADKCGILAGLIAALEQMRCSGIDMGHRQFSTTDPGQDLLVLVIQLSQIMELARLRCRCHQRFVVERGIAPTFLGILTS